MNLVPLRRRRAAVEVTLLGLMAALLVGLAPHPAAAATAWYVDGSSASCTDTAAGGTQSTPLCTITAAAKEVGTEKLKPIFDQLNGMIGYDQIRLAVACLRNQEP